MRSPFPTAPSDRVQFELAHDSTLFLDEIGELPTEVQVKLRRVLGNRTIERLGNPRPIPVDVRIMVATHRDLAGAVRTRRFRADLCYRPTVFPIPVPSVRDRREGIPLFVRGFREESHGHWSSCAQAPPGDGHPDWRV
ncbi:sigma 54-interacting transcriptional regulator [Candidatus Binatia bacterium]|nr:sigma 54-interacting transcriptional regulator [Candidatus Binatia bacterium]